MRLEMMRTFPVSRQRAWDYMDDFRTWPEWFNVEVVDPEKAVWEKPGDTLAVVERWMGIRFRETVILEERVAPELLRTLSKSPGFPDFHLDFHFENAGPGAFTLRMVGHVDEGAGQIGKSLSSMMMTLPFGMRRQGRLMFDRLDEVFRKGLPERKREVKKAGSRPGRAA